MAKNKHRNTTLATKTAAPAVDDTLQIDRDMRTTFEKVEHFVEDNARQILSILGVIALIFVLYLLYTNVYVPRQEAAAQADLFEAQRYFDKNDWDKVLNGDKTAKTKGALDVISSHSGSTKAVNLAHYYAGIAYLNKGEFQKAVDHLSDVSSNDDLVTAMANGALGDAYSELGKMQEALGYYQKAAASSPNEFTAPMFLLKAGLIAETQNNFKAAKSAYEQLVQKYPNSAQGKDADKYLTRAEQKLQ